MRGSCFYGGLFLVTAATLMLQLVQTRILSVVAWYHLAFFVISIAMFGLTAGAVWVYRRGPRFTAATLPRDLARFTAAFALSTGLALAVQLTLAPVAELSVVAALIWFELAVCIALPFFFSGVVVSLALTRSPFPIGRVYAADLAGAAVGCLGVLLLLDLVDGPTAVLAIAALTAAAAALFARSGATAGRSATERAGLLARPVLLAILLLVIAIANSLISPRGLHPAFVKGEAEDFASRLFEDWNSFSRIVVFGTPEQRPHMWGASPRLRWADWPTEQRMMNIDGSAGTAVYGIGGDVGKAGFLRWDVTNLGYFLPDLQRAAIIGVGGGRDLLSARVFGVPDITGVEINPIFHQLLTAEPGFAEFSGIDGLGGISIEVDEARSWFARSTESFDIIQMTLVDTWAATGAGAFSLTENGLYTVDAWRTFLERLTPSGVFTVSRWYAPENINETGRLLSLAVAAALDVGASAPRQHIFLATSSNVANLIVARQPFAADALGALEAAAGEFAFEIVASPNRPPASEVLATILGMIDRAQLERYTAGLGLDLTPPTDDRPFFFNQLPLYDPVRTIDLAWSNAEVGVISGNLFATATLGILFAISAIIVLATIVVPLRPAIHDVGRRLAFGGTAWFLLIGAGFMSTEIGLLQRMSVYLGHPIYALSIVLFSIILTTGIGSLVSDRLPLDSRAKLIGWALLTAGYLAALPFWLPPLLQTFDAAGLPLRAALCVAVIGPAGLLMGYGFPTGMRLIEAVDRRPTPWFWGINGAAGVLAATLAVAFSIAFGIGATLLVGAACYALLVPAALVIRSGSASPFSSRA